LARRPEGKRPGWRHKYTWRNNIIVDITEIWWEGVDWIHPVHGRDEWWAFIGMVVSICVL
jgi:hypothetical protein